MRKLEKLAQRTVNPHIFVQPTREIYYSHIISKNLRRNLRMFILLENNQLSFLIRQVNIKGV